MLNGYNKRGEELGAIDFIELQWNRKWSSCGDFTVYMAAKDYNPDIKYVKNVGRLETGIVQKVQYDEQTQGQFMTLSGFFLEKLADFGAYRKPYEFEGNPNFEAYMSLVFSSVKNGKTLGGANNLYHYAIDSTSELPASVDAAVERGTPAGQAIYAALSGTGHSYRCQGIYAPEDVDEGAYPIVGLNFVFKEGKDLRDKVFFGSAYSNVKKIGYTLDESAEKACYEVIQEVDTATGWSGSVDAVFSEKEDGETKYYIVKYYNYSENAPSGVGKSYPHKVLVANVEDVTLEPKNEAKILKQMSTQAKLDMLNNYKIETVAVEVLQERFYYLQDYDLGDVCSVYIDALQQAYTARIEEVREVHASNKVDIEIVIGTPTKQKWRTI